MLVKSPSLVRSQYPSVPKNRVQPPTGRNRRAVRASSVVVAGCCDGDAFGGGSGRTEAANSGAVAVAGDAVSSPGWWRTILELVCAVSGHFGRCWRGDDDDYGNDRDYGGSTLRQN